ELRDDAGDPKQWQDLPEDPEARLASLERECAACREQRAERERELAQRQAELQACGAEERRLLAQSAAIREAVGAVPLIEHDLELLDRQEGEAARLEGRLRDRAGELLAEPWREELAGPVLSLPLADLRVRLAAFREADQLYRRECLRAE